MADTTFILSEPIGPTFFVGPNVTPGKFMDDRIFKNLPLTKFDFRILKSTKCTQRENVHN